MKYYKLPTTLTTADAIILANGNFPTDKLPISILKNNKQIICCDGAINKLSTTNIVPQAIVGDCDSLSDENKTKYSSIIHQINEQDTNDLTKSIHFCINNGTKSIVILGATGNREDHTIANISLLSDYIDLIEDICMITDYGVFNAIKKTSEFESFEGQQVSLFSIIPTEISSIGLKYPIEKKVFTNWWQATLNESLSDKFKIKVDNKLIVYRTF